MKNQIFNEKRRKMIYIAKIYIKEHSKKAELSIYGEKKRFLKPEDFVVYAWLRGVDVSKGLHNQEKIDEVLKNFSCGYKYRGGVELAERIVNNWLEKIDPDMKEDDEIVGMINDMTVELKNLNKQKEQNHELI